MNGKDEMPLSVLMVDSHASIERGGAVQCAALARELARRGHRVTCVFDGPAGTVPPGQMCQSLRAAGVTVLRSPQDRPGGLLRFRHLVRTLSPHILHTHKNRALLFAWAATLGRRRPPWVANRGTVYPLWHNPLARNVHRRCVRRVLAVSRAVGEVLLKDGIDAGRVEVVYGSFDPDRFHPGVEGSSLRRAWGIPPGAPAVGMIASLNTPKKGHPLFLQAASLLAPNHPELKFVLVGEGPQERLKREVRRLGLADRIVFAGFVEEVPAALAALDVVVCASLRGEGLTGAIREALAMARPVVSTDVVGNRELVIPEETGLLVPPGDAQALAAAIGRLLNDFDLARKLGEAGRRRVLECCTDEVRAEKVEAVYRVLLQEG